MAEWKLKQLKKLIAKGDLQLAQLDENNKPVKIQLSDVQQKTKQINKNRQLFMLVSNLSWQQKYQWVTTRRIQSNLLFKQGNYTKAVQGYLQSLIGLDRNSTLQNNTQVKLQLQFPILLNITTCFYKMGQFQNGINICDQILKDEIIKDYVPAFYKKAYFLYQLGDYSTARNILVDLSKNMSNYNAHEKILITDIQDLFQKIVKKKNSQKDIYKKIFNPTIKDYSQQEQQTFIYNEGMIQKIVVQDPHTNRMINKFAVQNNKVHDIQYYIKESYLKFLSSYQSCYQVIQGFINQTRQFFVCIMISKRMQKSLLDHNKIQQQIQTFYVSVLNQDENVYFIEMVLDNYTVEETISLSIAKFNITHSLNLVNDLDQYEMFPAKRSGKKKSDMPSLSKQQMITKIGLNRFALCPLWMREKMMSSGQLFSLRSIETSFTQKRITKQINERNGKNNKIGCFGIC